jgi:4-hydroxysphinganine ceramide fatty acyl 2-hydroxylase
VIGSFLRHGSNALLVAGAALLAGCGLAGHPNLRLGAVAAGTLLFFLSEYGTHRFLLHAPPVPWQFVRSLQHRLHYDHHVEPDRLDLLFLPPWFLVPALALFGGLYAALTRDAATVASLVLGNVLGLLYYEWVHFVAHVPLRPITPFGRWIKKYHLRHHFRNEKLCFGVTNPALDALARTYAGIHATERSATTRSLFP